MDSLFFNLFINDLPSCLQFAKVLMFAVYVKLFGSFNYVEHAKCLRSGLSEPSVWRKYNNMLLKLKKCKRWVTILIDTDMLECVSSSTDLGLILNPELNFNLQIDTSINKVKALLDFSKHWLFEFKDPYIGKRLFTVVVRHILGSSIAVCFPNNRCYGNQIKLMHKLQKFALRDLRRNPANPFSP